MVRRVFFWLLPACVALAVALAAAIPGSAIARTTAIQQCAEGHATALLSAPLQASDAAMFGQWGDDDPDKILGADTIGVSAPLAASHHGRRIGAAVRCQRLLSAAFPRGPPSA